MEHDMRHHAFFKLALFLLIITSLLLPLKNADATWVAILNENFIGEWSTWPWFIWGNQWNVTPAGGYRWGIAAGYTHYPFEPFQCIWCAGLNGTQISNLDPFVDSYPSNLNTKVIWGPFSLADAAAAECNFWYLNDTQQTQDYLLWGAALDPNANTIYEGGRHSGPNATLQWVNTTFDFADLLTPQGQPVSLLGQANVYLAFYFHSDGAIQDYYGGFLDDINIGVDDGLFDLLTLSTLFFNPEDTTATTNIYEEVEYLIGLNWRCEGIGDTPPFTIECLVDGEPWLSETVTAVGGEDYMTYFDSLWAGDVGFHELEWTLDINDEIVESSEENNSEIYPFEVVMIDSLPVIEILTPTEGDTADLGFWVTWYAYDRESDARIYLFYDGDSAGFNGIQFNIGIPIYESDPDSFWWDTSNMADSSSVFVYGKIHDFTNGPVYDYSEFPLTIIHQTGVETLRMEAEDFTLLRNYPNPFNAATTINYSLTELSGVNLAVYDVEGRLIKNLVQTEISPGSHDVVWQADDVASGIYFARITVQGLKSGKIYSDSQKMLLVR